MGTCCSVRQSYCRTWSVYLGFLLTHFCCNPVLIWTKTGSEDGFLSRCLGSLQVRTVFFGVGFFLSHPRDSRAVASDPPREGRSKCAEVWPGISPPLLDFPEISERESSWPDPLLVWLSPNPHHHLQQYTKHIIFIHFECSYCYCCVFLRAASMSSFTFLVTDTLRFYNLIKMNLIIFLFINVSKKKLIRNFFYQCVIQKKNYYIHYLILWTFYNVTMQ